MYIFIFFIILYQTHVPPPSQSETEWSPSFSINAPPMHRLRVYPVATPSVWYQQSWQWKKAAQTWQKSLHVFLCIFRFDWSPNISTNTSKIHFGLKYSQLGLPSWEVNFAFPEKDKEKPSAKTFIFRSTPSPRRGLQRLTIVLCPDHPGAVFCPNLVQWKIFL